ncbi:hypothetical protein STEG23_006761 [Scotinomys teguina]
MTLWNVSMVMAPNLFLPRGQPLKLPKSEKQLAEGAAQVVCMMVQYQDLLWTVASFLVAQVRKLNDSNGRRSQLCDGGLKTWLWRTHVDRDKAGDELEATPKVAKIQVTWPSMGLLQVPLNPSTRVTHILKLFAERLNPGSQPENGSEDPGILSDNTKQANFLVYEVGGNIGEHCLDPDAYLLDLYRANPHAKQNSLGGNHLHDNPQWWWWVMALVLVVLLVMLVLVVVLVMLLLLVLLVLVLVMLVLMVVVGDDENNDDDNLNPIESFPTDNL